MPRLKDWLVVLVFSSSALTAIGNSQIIYFKIGSTTTGLVVTGLLYENGTLYAAANNMFWTVNPMSGALTFASNASGSVVGLAPTTPPATPEVLAQFVFGGGWYSAPTRALVRSLSPLISSQIVARHSRFLLSARLRR